jgi:hypothetical protein
MPQVLGVALYQSAETFAFGGALALLIAVFAGWLGGLLAPSRIAAIVPSAAVADPEPAVVEERTVTRTEVQRPRERFRLLPSAGRKGGERVEDVEPVEPVVEPVDEVEHT